MALTFLISTGVSLGQDHSAESLISQCNRIYHSNPDSSYQLALLAEKVARQNHQDELQGSALLKQVRYKILKSDLEQAAELINRSVEIFHRVESKKGLADAYSLSALVSGRLGKIQEEIAYLEKAHGLYIQAQDTSGAIKALTNLSFQYTRTKELEKAEKHLSTLNKLIADKGSTDAYYFFQNMGHLKRAQKLLEQALGYYQQARKIAEQRNMIDSRATIHKTMGELYQEMKKYGLAEKHLLHSLKISEENKLVYESLEAHEALQSYYEEVKDLKKAYSSFKKLVSIRDTLYNLEKVNRLNEYDKRLALSEQEKKIAQQEIEFKEQQLITESERSKNQILILVVVLITLLSVVAIYAFFKTKKLKDEIGIQKEAVEQQHKFLEEAYKNITDSIEYAKKIQQAVLKSEEHESKHLPEHFILFRPKDIVSGDFYWAQERNNFLYLAVADCTGHGVPGAFMSLLGIAFLNDILSDYTEPSPAGILDELRERIISELSQTGKDGESKDGMDISLIKINLETSQIEWAGAYSPLYIISEQQLKIEHAWTDEHLLHGPEEKFLSEIKPDKQPIGHHSRMHSFTNHRIQLHPGDSIYLFSDGYADQFGGEKGKKLKSRAFKELLLQLNDLSMDDQKKQIHDFFTSWKENHEQVDDICILGMKL